MFKKDDFFWQISPKERKENGLEESGVSMAAPENMEKMYIATMSKRDAREGRKGEGERTSPRLNRNTIEPIRRVATTPPLAAVCHGK